MMRKPLAAFLAAALVLAALGAAAHLLQAEAAAPDATKNIAACLQPFAEKNVVSGAVVLVATKEKVLGVGAVGYADVAARKPMQTDTVFWIASQTKPITATALMMLVVRHTCSCEYNWVARWAVLPAELTLPTVSIVTEH